MNQDSNGSSRLETVFKASVVTYMITASLCICILYRKQLAHSS